jgi:hypothetical protein
MKQCIKLSILLFFLVFRVYAQEAPKIKFGKVSDEELKMTVYEPDTTAEAVILFDDGNSSVRYDTSKNRFMLSFERFLRIKILKQSGTSWGNFAISLYSANESKEDLADVDGVTFNLVNGKNEKVVMKKDAVFKERENKYWEMVRLSLPSVKVGSVIDLKYTINSPLLWNLRTWKFQYTIPVKWSQFYVTYPEYFKYNHSSLGYHRLNSQDHTTKSESINYLASYSTGNSYVGSGRERVNESISYQADAYTYTAKEIPAMKEEPYSTTLENFTTRLKFELSTVDFTRIGGQFKNYTNTWTTISNELLNDEDFGGQLNGGNYVEDVVKELTSGKSTEMDKTTAIYSHLQNTVKWDGYRSYITSKPLRKTYSDKSGNSADLNLLLLVMLKKAGISAYPVILSTRDNGMLSPAHPSISDCNYVIVKANIDNNPVLLDATDPKIPAGQLPLRCMNGDGVLIRKDSPENVPITTLTSFEATSALLLMKDGKLEGDIITHLSGQDAYQFRQEVKNAGGAKEQFEALKNSADEIQYTDYSYKNLDSLYVPVEKKYHVVLGGSSDGEESILYINPVITGRLQENPFSAPTRNYPVDYGIPFLESYKLVLTVPEGYQVEELPKNKNIMIGDKDGKFSYIIGQMDNRVVVNMRFSIDKPLFLPAEYQNLKEFYDQVVAKQAEQIVLKKIDVQ